MQWQGPRINKSQTNKRKKKHPHLGVPNESIETKKKKEYVCGPWGVSTYIVKELKYNYN